MSNFDFSDIDFNSAVVTPEEPTTSKYNFDFSDVDLNSAEVTLDDISGTRKAAFGAADETTIATNLYRLGKAYVQSSLDGDLTVKDAILNIEKEHDKDLYKNFPEFRGFTEEQTYTDPYIVSGRIGQALVDPVTWLIPWTKAGQIVGGGVKGSAIVGAAVSAGDTALYTKAREGEVDLGMTAVSAGTGFAFTGLADLASRKMGIIGRDKVETELKTPKLTTQETQDVTEAANNVVKVQSASKENKRIKLDLNGEEKNFNTSSATITSQSIQQLETTYSKLTRLKKKAKGKEKKLKIQSQMDEVNKSIKENRSKFLDQQMENTLSKADHTGAMIEGLSEDGKLTDSILQKVIYETTRPVLGGIGGYSLSEMFHDESDFNTTASYILAGAGMGQLSKRLNASRLSQVDKETGLLRISEAGSRNLFSLTKRLSAGSLSARLDGKGGYSKVVGNMLFNRVGGGTDSVESRAIRETRKFTAKIEDILGDSANDVNVRKLAGQILNNFNVNDIKVGYKGINGDLKNLTQSQIDEAFRVSPLLKEQQDELYQSMLRVGIKADTLDENYGMAQLYNFANIKKDPEAFRETLKKALAIQNPSYRTDANALDLELDRVYKNFLGIQEKQTWNEGNIFKNGEFRPLTNHFEKHRLITNQDARNLMAENGYFNLDTREVFSIYADRSLKAREFADTFGAKGEVFTEIFKRIRDSSVGENAQARNFMDSYKQDIYDAVDAYWGVYGASSSRASSSVTNSMMGLFTTLANTTYLARVGIDSLSDLVQPFQNSGFGAATKAIMQKFDPTKDSFSKMTKFKYDDSFERELKALVVSGGDPLSTTQAANRYINQKFFTFNGLQFITRTARTFAYDSGINRAFDISRKKSFKSKGLVQEMETIGLKQDDINVLKKYKNVREAFDAEDGRLILDRIGSKVADRDAILPMVGNRLLFTQTKDPVVRSFGQFLSWAQAKTSQVNSLAERMERGDMALAVRMLGASSIYLGITSLKNYAKPGYDPFDSQGEVLTNLADDEEFRTLFKQSLEMSAQYSPFQVGTAVRALREVKNGEDLHLDSFSPSMGYIFDLMKGLSPSGGITNNIAAGDYEGAIKQVAEFIPLGREILGYGDRADIISPVVDRKNRDSGGIVFVPNAAMEPDERKIPNQPTTYIEQAGEPFVDEEDRFKFSVGSTVGRIGTKVARSLFSKADEVDTTQFNKITKDLEAGKTDATEEYVKTFKDVEAKIKAGDVSDDTLLPYDFVPEPASTDKMFDALAKDKKLKLNADVEEGIKVGLRLDIPAYTEKNTWIPTIHQGGRTLSHKATAAITNPTFKMSRASQETAYRIKTGEENLKKIKELVKKNKLRTGYASGDLEKGELIDVSTKEGKAQLKALQDKFRKNPFAQIGGNYIKRTDEENYKLAQKYLNDPEWTQVGFNPKRHSYYFDRKTAEPVIGGDEAIQIGPLVLVKNAIKGDRKDFKYYEGGLTLNKLRNKFNRGGIVTKAETPAPASDPLQRLGFGRSINSSATI